MNYGKRTPFGHERQYNNRTVDTMYKQTATITDTDTTITEIKQFINTMHHV